MSQRNAFEKNDKEGCNLCVRWEQQLRSESMKGKNWGMEWLKERSKASRNDWHAGLPASPSAPGLLELFGRVVPPFGF